MWGLEPQTYGLRVRRPGDVTASKAKDLRPEPTDLVPTLVPSSLGADPAASCPPLADPDLARVVDAWPFLAEAIKAGILAIVQAAGGPDA